MLQSRFTSDVERIVGGTQETGYTALHHQILFSLVRLHSHRLSQLLISLGDFVSDLFLEIVKLVPSRIGQGIVAKCFPYARNVIR